MIITIKLSNTHVKCDLNSAFKCSKKLYKSLVMIAEFLKDYFPIILFLLIAFVLSGGNTTIDKELSEDDMYALELEAFVQLIQMEKTQARIKHTLSTGKP